MEDRLFEFDELFQRRPWLTVVVLAYFAIDLFGTRSPLGCFLVVLTFTIFSPKWRTLGLCLVGLGMLLNVAGFIMFATAPPVVAKEISSDSIRQSAALLALGTTILYTCIKNPTQKPSTVEE